MPPKPANAKRPDTLNESSLRINMGVVDPCDPFKTFDREIYGAGFINKIIGVDILKRVNHYIFEKDFTPKIRPFVIQATLNDLQKGTCYHHYLQD